MALTKRIACLFLPDLPEQARRRSGRRVAGLLCQRSALLSLLELARSVSPLCEAGADDVLLEVHDVASLYGGEEALGEALLRAGQRLGLALQVGIAQGAALARLCARRGPWIHVLSAEHSRPAIADLPVELLAEALPESMTWEVKGRLHLLSARTLGEVASLSRGQALRRLGGLGVTLHRLCQGEDSSGVRPEPNVPRCIESDEVECQENGTGIDQMEELCEGLLNRLSDRLALLGKTLRRASLLLHLHDGDTVLIPMDELAPKEDPAADLLRRLRIALITHPPRGTIVAASALAQERPRTPPEYSGPLAGELSRLVLPGSLPERTAAMRTLHPPRPAEVLCIDGVPSALRTDGVVGRILRHEGPFRIRVGLGQPVLRDYYDIFFERGGAYRIFEDLSSGSWFVDGVYRDKDRD